MTAPAPAPAPLRVFYIGAGDPVAPRSGMDVVARGHIAELAEAPGIALDGVFVTLPADDVAPSFHGVSGFRADTRHASRGRKLGHLLSGKLLMSIGFVSRAARAAVRRGLAARPDVIVVDHIQALANVSLWRLIFGRTPFVFIDHNVTPDTLRDAAKLRTSAAARAFLRAEARQSWLMEAALLLRARTSVFISHTDADHYRVLTGARSVSLCPVIERTTAADGPATAGDDRDARRILFIGSPGFPPNRSAIDWIVRELAPRLLARDVPVIVSFIGGGTANYIGPPAANVETLGFVPDAEMERLLSRCLCMLSPVVHGSGLKIKVLEAFAAGAPVLATPLSLQGFGFMGVDPMLDPADPDAVVDRIAALAADPAAAASFRDRVRSAWAAHATRRRGALAAAIRKAAGGDKA
ncbi:MAG: glycosyltransferase family 4 protein [Sphingomonas paucimobilis]